MPTINDYLALRRYLDAPPLRTIRVPVEMRGGHGENIGIIRIKFTDRLTPNRSKANV